MKIFRRSVIAAGLILAAFLGGRATKPCPAPGRTVTRVDTVVVRDTVRDTVLVPQIRETVRTDTVWVKIAGDTVRVGAEIPVERKTYRTKDYRAVVEGFRPALVQMEVYRNTLHIGRETVAVPPGRPRRWGAGIQAGYGLTPKGGTPYIGVGVQYNIILW